MSRILVVGNDPGPGDLPARVETAPARVGS